MKDKVVVNYPHLGLKFSSLRKRFTGIITLFKAAVGPPHSSFLKTFYVLTNKI